MSAWAALPVGPFYTRDARGLGFAISNASAADLDAAATVVNEMLADGAQHARVAATRPLAEAARAHRMQEDPRVRGRVLEVLVIA